MLNTIIQGNCLEVLKTLEENSIDSIVTDPPYHLVSIVKRFGKEGSAPAKEGKDGSFRRLSSGFMGKTWDGLGEDGIGIANNPLMWAECLRVLKPGGYLLSFGGTRTYHRMACAIEDAGFEVRDMIEWCYGSGFPKSHNIGKSVDKLQGNEREDLGEHPTINGTGKKWRKNGSEIEYVKNSPNLTKGTSAWEGWGTALKPAHEPIIVSMKPLQLEHLFAILIDNIWNNLPVSDVVQNLRDTQAKLNEVVSSVPVNVRINFLENLENVEFVETLTTSLAIKLKKEKGNSVHENVAQSGEEHYQETKILLGEAEGAPLAAISTSVQMGDISENTVLSWKNISEELLNQTNTLTTRMAIRKIIELKTLRSCLILNTGINIGHSKKIPPNHEPICMARKPLSEKTVALNVLKYGTGGINIDESRVGTEGGGTHCNNRNTNGKCLGHKNAGRSTSGETIHADLQGNNLYDKLHLCQGNHTQLSANNAVQKESANKPLSKSSAQESVAMLGLENQLGTQQENTDKQDMLCSEEMSVESMNISLNTYGSGNERMEKSQRDMKSITSTELNTTTDLKTCSVCGLPTTGALLTKGKSEVNTLEKQGRFPSNLIHDNSEEVKECFPETGGGKFTKTKRKRFDGWREMEGRADRPAQTEKIDNYGDNGNASRFFKSINNTVKTEPTEVEFTTETGEMVKFKAIKTSEEQVFKSIIYQAKASKRDRGVGNVHPTVKSILLMSYLIKMVTPKGGIVLDPFTGSGSTLVAAKQNNFQYVGIELEAEYIKIAEKRLEAVQTVKQQTLI